MTDMELDVLGVGNAIIDVIAKVDDTFLEMHRMAKGGMSLIGQSQAETIYESMGPGIESSGGSAANTMVGVASLGGASGFIGKVKQDLLGKVFTHDLRAQGVRFTSQPALDGPATARCLVLVTPDAERTMNTFLGACVGLTSADIDEGTVAAARITYLEGYLFDPPHAKEAFRKAATVARAQGRNVALSLSDRFCVERHRQELLDFVGQHVDLLFANEDEMSALYPGASPDQVVEAAGAAADVVVMTRGSRGCLVIEKGRTTAFPALSVGQVVDTTGAGDLFAAGFLHGWARGLSLALCGHLGGLAAAEVISHIGARPQSRLANLAVADNRLTNTGLWP